MSHDTSSTRRAGRVALVFTGLLALAGCQEETASQGKPSRPPAQTLSEVLMERKPADDAQGCYAELKAPATVETVTEQVLARPETTDPATGVKTPALYRTETNHRIVKGGEAMWFRVPCEAEMTPDFIATLQRALAARALYFGPVTGEMDAATQGAVRAYQAPRGLLSPVLSYRAAQELGLIVWVEK
ncbi:MAG: peptidoglycan-binding protein [Sphingomonadales bacterium]|nr:peptidoglycan-binding protein [Sphingomonadales bacterium]